MIFFLWGGGNVVALSASKGDVTVEVTTQCVYVIRVIIDLVGDFVFEVWNKACVVYVCGHIHMYY